VLDQLSMKRMWESSNHPYLFFNEDSTTFTPLGFYLSGTRLQDCETGEVIDSGDPNDPWFTVSLKSALSRHEMSLSENFNTLPR